MPNEVERDVSNRHVLFKLGCAREPVSKALRQDECVIPKPQRVFRYLSGRFVAAVDELLSQREAINLYVRIEIFVRANRCGTPSADSA